MIQLTPQQHDFVQAQIDAGSFKDSSEVIQAGIELLRKAAAQRDYDETVREIRAAIPDMQADRGRPIEEADAAIRDQLGFTRPS
jgi:putative addiction module CopG family antidote